MIIMINGAFGSGKTTTAHALQALIPNSMIYDPELIGYMLRHLIPEPFRHEHERTDDFQDLDLWRSLTVKIAKELKQTYHKHLIVPMTIHKPINYEHIYRGFTDIDKELFHFCLVASEETLRNRLTKRGDVIGGWQFQQIEKCVVAFKSSLFEERIITDDLTTEQIVKAILLQVNHQTSS